MTKQQTPLTPEPLYNERAAAKLLGVKQSTLRQWRFQDERQKGNPNHVRKAPPHQIDLLDGRAKYSPQLLTSWLARLPKVDGVPQFPDNRRKLDRETGARK